MTNVRKIVNKKIIPPSVTERGGEGKKEKIT